MIPENEYLDRIQGCWMGKNLGGSLGEKYEGKKNPPRLEHSLPEESCPNDDLDLQLVWLEMLDNRGLELSAADFADAWSQYIIYPFDEYAVALANIKAGLQPPATGCFNNFFDEGMGAPIRSEIWGCMAPGNPAVAAHYAFLDSQVDHWNEGVYGEVFFAILQSMAFSESNVTKLIADALEMISAESKLHSVCSLVVEQFSAGVDPWEIREELLLKFGEDNFTHCLQNIGLTVLALLSGGGDLRKTLSDACNYGYDTDCTAATAGAILGIINGGRAILEMCDGKMDPAIIPGWGVINFIPPVDIYELSERVACWGEKLQRMAAPPMLTLPFALPEMPEFTSPLQMEFILSDQFAGEEEFFAALDAGENDKFTRVSLDTFHFTDEILEKFDAEKDLYVYTVARPTCEMYLTFVVNSNCGYKMLVNRRFRRQVDKSELPPLAPSPHRLARLSPCCKVSEKGDSLLAVLQPRQNRKLSIVIANPDNSLQYNVPCRS